VNIQFKYVFIYKFTEFMCVPAMFSAFASVLVGQEFDSGRVSPRLCKLVPENVTLVCSAMRNANPCEVWPS